MHDAHQVYDAIMIGGGPAGLSAALILGRCRRKVMVIDAGRPRNAAAQSISGYLGLDGIDPREFRERGRGEVARYGVEVVAGHVVDARSLEACDSPFRTAFELRTEEGRTARCRKLLFATGIRDELPAFPGIRECYGVSVHHCPYCDGWEHRDERIVVCAHQVEEAAGLALAVRGWSRHVTLLCDGQSVEEDERSRLLSRGIALCEERIVRFLHEGKRLSGVECERGRVVPADALFCGTIKHPGCDVPQVLGVHRNDEATGQTNRKQRTNVPGLFLAGDADGNVEFVIVAAAEGATAAVAMNRELEDENRAGGAS